jgi:hypothetical protein
MQTEHLSTSCKFVQAITYTAGAAGAIDVEGAVVDMSGFSGICAVVQFGAIQPTSVIHINMVQSDVVAMSNPDDLAGSKQAIAADKDNKVFYLDVLRPQKRFVQLHVDIGTDTAAVSAMYILYGADKKPVTHDATTIAGERHKDAIAGTA